MYILLVAIDTHTQICNGGSVLFKCCDYATVYYNVDDVINALTHTFLYWLLCLNQEREMFGREARLV